MRNSFRHFLKGLSIYAVLLLLIGVLLFTTILNEFYLPVFPIVLGFYFLSTLLFHNYMIILAKKDDIQFGFKFMILSFAKMVFYIIFGLTYILYDEIHAVIFLIFYVILYFAFTVYEIRSMLKLINELKS